jgi:hypothetical protein
MFFALTRRQFTAWQKIWLSLLCYAAMLVLPLISFVVGWFGWDAKTGAIAAISTFAIFFIAGGGILFLIKDISPVAASLPFVMGMVYALLQDLLPGPLDDSLLMASGAVLSFILWRRKMPETPLWVIFPMVGAAIYTILGVLIPGPFDELIVYIATCGAVSYGLYRGYQVKSFLNPEAIPPESAVGTSPSEEIDNPK